MVNFFHEIDRNELALADEYLRNGRYYLITGSGVSLDAIGPDGDMLSANSLRQKLVSHNNIPETSSLQQAYNLLEPHEVDTFLTNHYTCRDPGPTNTRISLHPWRRIYTLNIDNCYETAFKKFIKEREFEEYNFEIKNYVDDFSDISADVISSIIHLHGAIERSSDGYVFSHTEYARMLARTSSWMSTLSQLIRTEPFVIMGTSLDEIDVTFYLEQRTKRNLRTDSPPSFLVEPYPNKLTEKLCEQHGFYLYKGTAIDFLNDLKDRSDGNGDFWSNIIAQGIESVGIKGPLAAKFGATFDLVPSAPPSRAQSFAVSPRS